MSSKVKLSWWRRALLFVLRKRLRACSVVEVKLLEVPDILEVF